MHHGVLATVLGALLCGAKAQLTFNVPSTAPASAVSYDLSLLSISIEFFAFPEYMNIKTTSNCIANLQSLRGTPPAVRIGGTTQYVLSSSLSRCHFSNSASTRDRATYDPSLATAVNYTVASSADAPASLTFGPMFFDLASELPGDVTIGLNRQLNNLGNTQAAAERAISVVDGLLALELGNEPDREFSNFSIACVIPN